MQNHKKICRKLRRNKKILITKTNLSAKSATNDVTLYKFMAIKMQAFFIYMRLRKRQK
jgi:hypothetical protein